ncbi:MAG: histidinol dehydrogenase [spirochete symbiont of Stewartia floridana]|nr:MAG: histidinol dehydrogenase [spirochete symbiont of Stewartia floridana]
MTVNFFRWSELDEKTRARLLSRSESDIQDVLPAAAVIIEDIRTRGDRALIELNQRFDKAPAGMKLRVPDSHFDEAEAALSAEVKSALAYSIENVRRYHQDQCPSGICWKEIRPGIMAGERSTPIDSAAFYVPRARGSFPSMLYMMAVPAQIAGVRRTVMASPPDSKGRVDAACLYTARLCGVQEVYAAGGAQAWAALAYGTESIRKVDKCLGPGSKYVAAAKKILFETIDCGLPAGPSESVILADSTPNPEDIARNLLVEAEHGSDSAALLITDSPELAAEAMPLLSQFGEALPEPRRSFVTDVFSGYGGIIVVDSMSEGIDLVNQYAAEHLQIRCADPFAILGKIRNAGEIILGDNCPFSAANYSVGANAVLPTGGWARTWSGVSAADFKKRSSVIYLSKEGLAGLKHQARALAEYEEFPAHRDVLLHRRE